MAIMNNNVLPERTVEVGGHKYTFRLLGARKAYKECKQIISKLGCFVPMFFTGSTEYITEKLDNFIDVYTDEVFDKFIDIEQLKIDGKLVKNQDEFDIHFAGRCFDLPTLLVKVIMENDRTFFMQLPTLITTAMKNLREKLQANSLKMPDNFEEVAKTVAQTIDNNLS